MSTPFAPFFVLLCYVIETSSLEDLKVLQDFVISLDVVRGSSDTVSKLYWLCHVMCDAALSYVEAKLQQQDQYLGPVGDEFEMYLNQLGLIPGACPAVVPATDTSTTVQSNGQTTYIADWFSGSVNMIGLLEEDLSHIGSGGNGVVPQNFPGQDPL